MCHLQAEVVKLEQEAAGIGLATEEEYAQYQQLKQVTQLDDTFQQMTAQAAVASCFQVHIAVLVV